MKTIQLKARHEVPNADALEGTFLDSQHFDRVITEDTLVLRPDGSILLRYVPNALSRGVLVELFGAVRYLPLNTANRGTASGQRKTARKKRDGTASRTRQTDPVPSGVLGYQDPTARRRFCGLTALSHQYPEALTAAARLAVHANDKYKELAPAEWKRQRRFTKGIAPGLVLPDSVVTSVTVNNTWRTAAHRDAGNFRNGLGLLCVLEAGSYKGGELVFPRWRTAVDMRTGGLLLADVAGELHANAPMTGERFQRISAVLYARRRMCRGECRCLATARDRESLEDFSRPA